MQTKSFFLTIALLAASMGVMAQTGELQYFNQDGKYGYKDENGNVVIQPIYDDAGSFSDGLTRVKLNGKWGLIDKTGKEVIPFIYYTIGDFSEGLARAELINGEPTFKKKNKWEYIVIKDSKWGFIDKTGKEVVPFIYDDAGSFSGGIAIVKLNDKWGFIDNTGKEVIPLIYDSAEPFKDGLARVTQGKQMIGIDPAGEVVYSFKNIYDYVGDFIDGVAIVDKSRGNMSQITNSSPQPWSTTSIAGSLANYTLNVSRFRIVPWQGLIDKTGKEIIPLKPDRMIKQHTDGTFEIFKRKEKNGLLIDIVSTGKFYDKTGKEIKGKKKTEWQ